MERNKDLPWSFLDEYRGTRFQGEWPTVSGLFFLSVERYPDRPCFTVYEPDRVSLSYREAGQKIEAVARKLRSIGIVRGSKVAVSGKNSPEWAVAYLAVLRSGAVVVPIDYQLSVPEMANLVRAGDVEALFIDEEKEAELTAACQGLKAIYSLAAGRANYIYGLDDSDKTAFVETKAQDMAAILFTSGTTGQPKGVMLSHENLVADCFLAQGNMRIYHTDVFYALLPIHHSYTMLAVFIESFSVGAELVFGKRLVVPQILKDLKEAKVTMFLGVPMLFNKLLAGIMKGVREKGPVVHGLIRTLMVLSGFIKKMTGINPGKTIFRGLLDKASLASIRICISGGGPLAPSVFRQYNELGIDFVQGYGLTETSPIITLNPTDAFVVTSVGKLIPRVEMRILDPDSDGRGEISVRGPMVMAGYYKSPEQTAEVLSSDGWFRTGDVGYIDDKNYVYLTGRAKNLIVTEGGKKVFPEEIENRFQLYDEIEQILIAGYIDNKDKQSEAIEARVFPVIDRFKTGAGIDWAAAEKRLHEVVDEVNQKLLPYQKISRLTVLRERLAETTTKKIKRGQAAEKNWKV